MMKQLIGSSVLTALAALRSVTDKGFDWNGPREKAAKREGQGRARLRLIAHRKRWAETPILPATSRQVRRAQVRAVQKRMRSDAKIQAAFDRDEARDARIAARRKRREDAAQQKAVA